ncbi:inducible alternative oxidase 2, partial [Mortierella antarctica]
MTFTASLRTTSMPPKTLRTLANTNNARFLSTSSLASLARPCQIIAPATTVRIRQETSASLQQPHHNQIRAFSLFGSGASKPDMSRIPKEVKNDIPEVLLHESHPLPMRDEFMGKKRLSTKDLEAIPIDLGFHREPSGYIHRVVALETVAAVPGMVAGMLRHLRSLRRCTHDGGWISHLLHEAENERMHLLTWMKVAQPTLFERAMVTAVQGVFFNVFFAL